jgi:small-conductance mechanosensitive channel
MEQTLEKHLFYIGRANVTVETLIEFVVILIGSYVLARLARRLIANRLLPHRLTMGVRYALARFTSYFILLMGFAAALGQLGVSLTAFTAFGAALGVGLGFGLQDIAKNFVSGLILLIERPIQVGDRIELGSVSGDVIEIRTRATVVRTNDDVHLIIPNAKFISDTVTNRSFGNPRVRYRIPIGVSYGSDPREVEKALLKAARGVDGVLPEPTPTVLFHDFGESSLNFELLCWTSKMLHRPGTFRSELNFAIHAALKARGIEVPFPQPDLHIRSAQGLEPYLRPGEARKMQNLQEEEEAP